MNLNEWLFSGDGGKTSKSLSHKFVEDWNASRISKDAGQHVRLKFTVPNLLFDAGGARWRSVMDLIVDYIVVENYWLKYFAPVEYRAISSYISGNVDVSKVKIGQLPLDLSDGWQLIAVKENFPIEPCGVIVQVEYPILDPRLSEMMGLSVIEESGW